MKDVKRFDVQGKFESQDGEGIVLVNPKMVLETDYDAKCHAADVYFGSWKRTEQELAAETLRADTAEADYRELSAENDSLLFRASAAEQRVSELLALLKKSSEIFWAVQDDLGAISASAVGVMWGKIDAALNPKPEAGSHAK